MGDDGEHSPKGAHFGLHTAKAEALLTHASITKDVGDDDVTDLDAVP